VEVKALAGNVATASLNVTEYSILVPMTVPEMFETVGRTVSRTIDNERADAGPATEAKSFTAPERRVSVLRLLFPVAVQVKGIV
jgi:hypothetical protein